MSGGCDREGSGGWLGEAGYLRKLLEEEADLESPWRPSVCDPHPPYDYLKTAVSVTGISVSVKYDPCRRLPVLWGMGGASPYVTPTLVQNQAPTRL